MPYHFRMDPVHRPTDERWLSAHLGRLLAMALQRFDAAVLAHMTHDPLAPMALSNLAARQQIGAAHIHITRHLPLQGARLTQLAETAGMSKQAMGDLVSQCEAWGLVSRSADPLDARARRVVYTSQGLQWREAFERAVAQAQRDFDAAVGTDVATVARLGLEAYVQG